MSSHHIIIGTAGHVDHGKTALVKALTGQDTDRLKEEKARGLTIDLGFAHWGDVATIIDVPGHERFIKNMVAGVSTIDLVLFLVAADDGVMPQTREHLDILKLLGVRRGVIVLNKIDLVEDDWRELVKEDLTELTKDTFLEDAPIFEVSATTGQGVPELKSHLESLFPEIEARRDRGAFWLPVDRVFSKKGYGTVVTGSVISGIAHAGEEMSIMPAEQKVRVRGLQSHGHGVESVRTGDRAAVNLQGAEVGDVSRGDVLTTPGIFRPSRALDVRLTMLKSSPVTLKNRAEVRLHIGTREVMARVQLLGIQELAPGETGYAQLKLADYAVALRLHAFVIRRVSPMVTIGGGVILDTNPRRHRRFDDQVLGRLKQLEKARPEEALDAVLMARGLRPASLEEIARGAGVSTDEARTLIDAALQRGAAVNVSRRKAPAILHTQNLAQLRERIKGLLEATHEKEPLRAGLRVGEIESAISRTKLASGLMEMALTGLLEAGEVTERQGVYALPGHDIRLTDEETEIRRSLLAALEAAEFAPPSPADIARERRWDQEQVQRVLAAMQALEEVVLLPGGIAFARGQADEAEQRFVAHLREHEEATASELKDLLGTSRKYAMPLLEYFDSQGITERLGDVRILGRKYADRE